MDFREISQLWCDKRAKLRILMILASLVSACGGSETQDLRVKHAVAPAFPEIMAQAHAEGHVVVRVTVGPSGLVTDAKVKEVDGSRATLMTDKEYEQLAREWTFFETGRSEEVDLHFVYEAQEPETPLPALGTTFEFPSTVKVRGRKVVPQPTQDFVAPR